MLEKELSALHTRMHSPEEEIRNKEFIKAVGLVALYLKDFKEYFDRNNQDKYAYLVVNETPKLENTTGYPDLVVGIKEKATSEDQDDGIISAITAKFMVAAGRMEVTNSDYRQKIDPVIFEEGHSSEYMAKRILEALLEPIYNSVSLELKRFKKARAPQ